MSLSYMNSSIAQDSGQANSNMSSIFTSVSRGAQLEVRIGYFGLCVRQKGILWMCSSDKNGLVEQIGQGNDPLNLIWIASKFRDEVLFSGLLFMAIVLAFISCVLVTTFPGWHDESSPDTGSDVQVRPFPSKPVSQIATAAAFVASTLGLVASLWQHIGAVGAACMADSTGYGSIKTAIGTTAMILGWCGFACIAVTTVGLMDMISSIATLERLVDNN